MEKTIFIGRIAARALVVVAGVGLPLAASGLAWAQTAGFDSGDPAVTVDLSVLDGASSAAGAISSLSPATGFRGRLLMPGAETPVSRLHIKPSGNVAIAAPTGGGRLDATSGTTPAMPPAAAPKSTLQARPALTAPPEARVAPPARPQSAPSAPTSVPGAPRDTAAAPPPPAVEKPQTAAAAPEPAAKPAPPPPAVEKPQAAVAAPEPAVRPAAPPPPVIDKPAAIEKPEAPAPQAPATVVPPPPPAVADAGAVASAPAAPVTTEQAALPKTAAPTQPGDALRVIFEAEEAKLSEQARSELKTIVQGILDKSELRLQLLAYAGGESLSSSRARRLSLSRALAVRSFLIENGLRSTRIDVRALGDKTTEQPVNRVDVNIVER